MTDQTTRLRDWIANLRYQLALFIHAIREPLRPGDPLLGRDRETRNRNIRLMSDRWFGRGPKPEDFK